ncbi:hypothetical protein IBX65_00710 [Candidatus Aerophobetes bacterium]|nr:hypothetical protein [Candidatus Aerophobetes bacterium]
MLDRKVVKEFLEEEFKDIELEIPRDISKEALIETFCRYTEDDLYEWLKDNFKSFFNRADPNWDWVKDRIRHYAKD